MKTNIFTKIFILAALSTTALQIKAEEFTVVDVKRNITLSDDDTVYKDYYINAGDGTALRKNLVVTVKRKINIKDTASKAVGDFETVVGQLKVIHVGNKVSVAREYKLIPRDEEPMLEQIGIMSGDRVDMNGSFIDNTTRPALKNKKVATEPVLSPVPAAAAAATATALPETKTSDAGAALKNADQSAGAEPVREPAREQAIPVEKPYDKIIPLPEI